MKILISTTKDYTNLKFVENNTDLDTIFDEMVDEAETNQINGTLTIVDLRGPGNLSIGDENFGDENVEVLREWSSADM